MSTSRRRGIPTPLENVRRRFERWRRTRTVRTPIPESLWTAAVKMAGKYAVHQTAKALRIDYYELKKRAQAEGFTSTSVSEPAGGHRDQDPDLRWSRILVMPQPRGGVVSVVKDRGRSALVAHQFFVVKWLRSVLAVGALVDRLLHRTALVIVLRHNGLRRRRARRIILTTMQKGGMP